MIPASISRTSSTTPRRRSALWRVYSLEQYLADEKSRAAVERVLETCGEAMNGLYKVAPAIAEKIGA